jgi:DNA-directed RNA polymerase specialized sigma24 family protein
LEYENGSLATSDGEAYRASGRGLDSIGKNRLTIETPWEEVNKELRVSTAFADDIITGWTQSQSRVMFQSLTTGLSHAEIGDILGISRQMVDKALRAGKEDLMNLYLDRFAELIKKHLG